MDCNHARLLLIFARKRSELEATEAEALDAHLRNCSPCAGLAEAERRLDESIGEAIRDVPMPAGLHGRLLAGLDRDRSIRRWHRGLTTASLAAGLLLAVGLAWFFWIGARVTPDYEDLYVKVSDKVRATPEAVEAWFQDQGLPMEAPRQFNYDLLISYDTAQFMNRRVPRLVFFHRGDNKGFLPAVAEVYVLSGRQFHLDQAPQHPASMELFMDNPNFQYVAIVSTGGSLMPFRVDRVQN
jgi:hypothetical protein